jgi:hypothetical protein
MAALFESGRFVLRSALDVAQLPSSFAFEKECRHEEKALPASGRAGRQEQQARPEIGTRHAEPAEAHGSPAPAGAGLDQRQEPASMVRP